MILGGARMRAPRMDQYGDLVLYMVPVYRTSTTYVPRYRYTYSLYMYDLYVHVLNSISPDFRYDPVS